VTFNFSSALLSWFDEHGRKDLPWQQEVTPYRVWLSEIMLQQTQVNTVIGYFERFVATFPDLKTLANSDIDDVLALWTGLGYYARARNLHKTAQLVMADYNGELPNELEQLIALPGIGRSTAGAIMALGFHQRFPILDGNVKRVLCRFYAIDSWPGVKATENQLWSYAEALLPETRFSNYIQAQMDLGATLCTRSRPNCSQCPLQSNCRAFALGNVSDYPVSKPKKISPLRKTHWIIAQNQHNQILLEKRPDTGIWGGLWVFPALDSDKSIREFCQSELNISIQQEQSYPAVRHVFSHFKLDIYPHIFQCHLPNSHQSENKNGTWYRIDEALALGLPKPVKSLLISLQ
jgi:A/G-specific adenine glycosylase